MSVTRTWLPEYRHVPRLVKTGWFSSKVVFVLQQKYRDTGYYISPEPYEVDAIDVDNVGWADCEHIEGVKTI